jgi:putative membrane protein
VVAAALGLVLDAAHPKPFRPSRGSSDGRAGWFNGSMPEPSAPLSADVAELLVKQTLMAAERTWLTWWRSALVATAGSLAVGRVTPQALHVAAWPYVLLGVGYGVLAIGMVLVGAWRQRRLARAVVAGVDSTLDSRLVAVFTAGSAALGVCTIALVLAQS